jgi:hypothetical protein
MIKRNDSKSARLVLSRETLRSLSVRSNLRAGEDTNPTSHNSDRCSNNCPTHNGGCTQPGGSGGGGSRTI